MKWIVLGVVLVVVVVAAICLFRALRVKPKQPWLNENEVDPKRARFYGEQLGELIRQETVSHVENTDMSKFYRFHQTIETMFPHIHQVCEKHDFNGSLLFRWPGLSGEDPVLVMNHFDVVEASGNWDLPPFSGEIKDGKVWGRGAVDDKGPFYVMYRGIEELIAAGYVPKSDVYIASSCTEEIGGSGAPATAQYLKEQGIRLRFLIDEGGMIVDQPLPGLNGLFAMVGVVEKGYGDVKFTAKGKGGHASAPPSQSPLVRLGEFMASIEKHYPLTAKVPDTLMEMIHRLSPHLPLSYRLVTENMWLFKPVLKKVAVKVPQLAAMTRTTVAFTTAKGSEGYNVLPQEAYVTANVRYIPHQPNTESNEILRTRAAEFDLETTILKSDPPAPVVDYRKAPFKLVESCIQTLYPGMTVSPYIMTGGTDAKYYNELTDDGIRFAPLRISSEQMASIHALNENIDIASLPLGVDFYKLLIKGL